MARVSDYICAVCGKSIADKEIVEVTQRKQVVWNDKEKLWDFDSCGNEVSIRCDECTVMQEFGLPK